MFISPTAAADYNERFRDMYTFSELILNIRKVGKIDIRKMQGQSAFSKYLLRYLLGQGNFRCRFNMKTYIFSKVGLGLIWNSSK